MKPSLSLASRSGARATELRLLLSQTIQLLVDKHNSFGTVQEPRLLGSYDQDTNVTVHRDLFSPGLLSLDLQTILRMGIPPQHVVPVPVFMTLLTAASLGGDIDLVKTLINGPYGCSADETSRSCVSPLLAACFGCHFTVLETLLNASGGIAGRRTEPNVENMINACYPAGACGRTLIEAVSQGPRADSVEAVSIVRLLLRLGLRINAVDHYLRAPLEIALSYKRVRLASLLCESGATFTRESLLHYNAIRKDSDSDILIMSSSSMAELEAYVALATTTNVVVIRQEVRRGGGGGGGKW